MSRCDHVPSIDMEMQPVNCTNDFLIPLLDRTLKTLHHFKVRDVMNVKFAFLFQSYGVDVEPVPAAQLEEMVYKHVNEDNMVYLHSFDDVKLIAGHAR